MTDTHSEVLSTVTKFFAALQSGDMATCETLFTEDGVVWHNYEQSEQSKAEALTALSGLAQLNARFEIIGRDVIGNTCVQRHVVRVLLPGGEVAAIPALHRISLEGNRIRRIEEYMDSAQMAAAMHALQARS